MPTKKPVKKASPKVSKVVKKSNMPAKKAAAKMPAKPAQPVKLANITKPFNRAEVIKHLTAASSLQKKDVVAVMDALVDVIGAHLKKRGPGEFTLLGLAKFRVVHKAATKARKGVNPFTGEPTTFAAKPARYTVKIRPLRRVKDLVV